LCFFSKEKFNFLNFVRNVTSKLIVCTNDSDLLFHKFCKSLLFIEYCPTRNRPTNTYGFILKFLSELWLSTEKTNCIRCKKTVNFTAVFNQIYIYIYIYIYMYIYIYITWRPLGRPRHRWEDNINP